MQLLRVISAFDWKYRPTVTVEVLAVSDLRYKLIEAMEKDIASWPMEDRWEIETESDLRVFASHIEGESESITYHILD